MSNFNTFVNEQLARDEVAREYQRLAPFYRLADQLVSLRKKRSLSQSELAEKAETTQAVVSRLENVSVHCSLESIVRLAEALDALVEVRLIPSEDLAKKEIQVPGNQPCKENGNSLPGLIYFGKTTEQNCADLMWSTLDPTTSQVTRRKQRVQEFA
jgi:transcriptional regulator with XRE-family HTH domain